jgi:hypothetical protein
MLTDSQVGNTKLTDRPCKLADSRDLYSQIAPNGGRYWRFSYRFQGKQKILAPRYCLCAGRSAPRCSRSTRGCATTPRRC